MERLATALVALALLACAPHAAAGSPEYELFYDERVTLFEASGTLEEGGSKGFRFTVAEPNVTRVDFLLTWKETGDSMRLSAPDRFSLSVTPPAGIAPPPTERASDGDVQVVADRISAVPEGGPASTEEAAERLEARSERGLGTWKATVTLESAGNPDGARVDEGNTFALTVALRYYEGYAMRVVTLTNPVGIAATPDRVWPIAFVTLGVLAFGLAGTLVAGEIRRRRALSPARVTPAVDVSPEGATHVSSRE